MILKSSSSQSENSSKKLRKPFKSNKFFFLFLISSLLIGLIFLSIYYGMYLNRTGKSRSLDEWVSNVAIHKLRFIPNYLRSLGQEVETIRIDVKFKNVQKLKFKREKALERSFLISNENDWVAAKIQHNNEIIKAKIRLKGDLADHWKHPEKWSFKVKIKGNKSLFSMKRFAIQDPFTRTYLNEWYLHQLLKYNGLIYLRYNFIDVVFNGNDLGIYAIEENFEKRLIENNHLKEGPLFRFNSGVYWGSNQSLASIFSNASIMPYQEKKILSDSNLQKQFDRALYLFNSFREGQLKASDVFDIKKLAKLLALCDLLGYHHALSLDNLKFYYNPISSLIEPIAYDNNAIVDIRKHGLIAFEKKLHPKRVDTWIEALFSDPLFYKAYIQALKILSEKTYLDSFFAETDKLAQEKLNILHQSDPWYEFSSKKLLYSNQKQIKSFLEARQRSFSDFIGYKNGTIRIGIKNASKLALQLESVVVNNKVLSLDSTLVLDAYSNKFPQKSIEIQVPYAASKWKNSYKNRIKINTSIFSLSDSYTSKVSAFHASEKNSLSDPLLINRAFSDKRLFFKIDEENKTIRIKSGKWNVDKSIIIPSSYKLIATPPLSINLTKEAMFISRSAIHFIGTEMDSIRITSEDGSGKGLFVLSANDTSIITYTSFKNLSNPQTENWELSSAITFYESPVKIKHSLISNSQCEDALNIVRSDFLIDETRFLGSKSDAFDSDFSSGTIRNSSFIKSGNDAIDISGTNLKIENIWINTVADKGLSVGEGSTLVGSQIIIKNSEIAVSSKDKSIVDLEGIKIFNASVALNAFQKKTEFGPGKILLRNYESIQNKIPYLIEQNSFLSIDGVTIDANQKNVKDDLYGVKYGKKSH